MTRLQFNRMELAGSLGDLGTLLPIVVGMILINRLSPTTVFLAFGLFYLMTGFYYRLPIPVQPLKAVGAIAIAYPNQITESVIGAGGILFGLLLLVLSVTGTVDRLARLFTQPVVRGIQLALGLVFLKKGIELIVTQKVFLSGVDGRFSGYPINLVMGFIVFALVLALLDNKKFPAALAALAFGIIAGLALGGFQGQSVSIGPTRIELISPSLGDFWTAFIMLILPQIPLTIGNACVGTADMCSAVFPNSPLLSRTKAGRFALTMGLANLPAGFSALFPCVTAQADSQPITALVQEPGVPLLSSAFSLFSWRWCWGNSALPYLPSSPTPCSECFSYLRDWNSVLWSVASKATRNSSLPFSSPVLRWRYPTWRGPSGSGLLSTSSFAKPE